MWSTKRKGNVNFPPRELTVQRSNERGKQKLLGVKDFPNSTYKTNSFTTVDLIILVSFCIILVDFCIILADFCIILSQVYSVNSGSMNEWVDTQGGRTVFNGSSQKENLLLPAKAFHKQVIKSTSLKEEASTAHLCLLHANHISQARTEAALWSLVTFSKWNCQINLPLLVCRKQTLFLRDKGQQGNFFPR